MSDSTRRLIREAAEAVQRLADMNPECASAERERATREAESISAIMESMDLWEDQAELLLAICRSRALLYLWHAVAHEPVEAEVDLAWSRKGLESAHRREGKTGGQLTHRARLDLGASLVRCHRTEEALAVLEAAVEMGERVFGKESPQVAQALSATALLTKSDAQVALTVRALAISERSGVATLRHVVGLALAMVGAGEREAAVHLLESELAALDLTGQSPPGLPMLLHALSGLYRDNGRASEAIPIAERMISLARDAIERNPRLPPVVLTNGYVELATALRDLGRPREALAAVEYGVDVLERAHATEPSTALLVIQAELLFLLGREPEARRIATDVIQRFASFGDGHELPIAKLRDRLSHILVSDTRESHAAAAPTRRKDGS